MTRYVTNTRALASIICVASLLQCRNHTLATNTSNTISPLLIVRNFQKKLKALCVAKILAIIPRNAKPFLLLSRIVRRPTYEKEIRTMDTVYQVSEENIYGQHYGYVNKLFDKISTFYIRQHL